MQLLKTDQLKKTEITKKKCDTCLTTRDLKFFSSKLARTCGDCKRKKWAIKLKNRPGKVNKSKDTQWALAVKQRDGFKCVYCGTDKTLNSHHLFTRSNRGLRWDLDNGLTLCASHHKLNSTFSAHGTPLEFIEWLKELKGIEWYENLRFKAKQTIKESHA